MKKNLLLALLALASASAQAQDSLAVGKLEGRLARIVEQQSRATRAANTAPMRTRGVQLRQGQPLNVTISTHSDAPELVAAIQALGGTATRITDTYYTAQLPAAAIATIAQRPEVRHIAMPRQLRKNLIKARPAAGVDKVQRGEALETPFTGKGVVLGVIDQGFQFDHIAFQTHDNKSRIVEAWARRDTTKQTIPSASLPANETDASHATHVAAIAAGTDWGNGYQGVAPDADLVFVPSSLLTDKIAEEVQYIKEYANKQHKPWVINMSFGSQMGGHDGTSSYDVAMDQLIEDGGFISAAMGNEGGMPLHASGTLNPGEVRYLFVDPALLDNGYEDTFFGIWGQNTDGKNHFKFTTIFCINEKIVVPSNTVLNSLRRTGAIEDFEEIDGNSQKQVYASYSYPTELIAALAKQKLAQNDPLLDIQLGVKIELAAGETQPQDFHAWVEVGMGNVSKVQPDNVSSALVLKGDDKYLVAEGGASIPRAFAVGSFNTTTSWKGATDGGSYRASSGQLNAHSTFSSPGPWLGTRLKPTISAPGSMIGSALNSSSTEWTWNRSKTTITDGEVCYVQTINGKKHYYCMMEGTSMATPFLSGVLCLWLEAYPQLSYDQAIEVMRKTATRDTYTGTAEWNADWGYGKIDAYEGLKEVLALAKTTGVERVSNSTTPISLSKRADEWRILFNNDERFAQIRLFNAAGQLLQSQQLSAVAQGTETLLTTAGLAPGVYVVKIQTAATATAHRFVVE